MILISHRGNLEGPDPLKENSPDYIDQAINKNFHAEIDLHKIGNDLYLGHDYPQYKIKKKFLDDRKHKLLIHAKNFEAAKMLQKTEYHFLFHFNDKYTLTSKGYFWIHDLELKIDKKYPSIIPLMSKDLLHSFDFKKAKGICSDYILKAKEIF